MFIKIVSALVLVAFLATAVGLAYSVVGGLLAQRRLGDLSHSSGRPVASIVRVGRFRWEVTTSADGCRQCWTRRGAHRLARRWVARQYLLRRWRHEASTVGSSLEEQP